MGRPVNKNLQQRFQMANSSLEELARELENQSSVVELDVEELQKLKLVIDRVRRIVWQLQQNIQASAE